MLKRKPFMCRNADSVGAETQAFHVPKRGPCGRKNSTPATSCNVRRVTGSGGEGGEAFDCLFQDFGAFAGRETH